MRKVSGKLVAELKHIENEIQELRKKHGEKEKDKEQFYKDNCLLEQAFIKDPALSIKDYLGSLIAKMSENIFIRRFIRYKIGE